MILNFRMIGVVITINLVYPYNWNHVFHKKNKTKTYYKNYDKLSLSKQMLSSPTFYVSVNQMGVSAIHSLRKMKTPWGCVANKCLGNCCLGNFSSCPVTPSQYPAIFQMKNERFVVIFCQNKCKTSSFLKLQYIFACKNLNVVSAY